MILLLLLLSGALARASAAAASSRETVNFDLAWRFQAVAGSSAWPPADPSPSCAFGPEHALTTNVQATDD